MASRMHPVAEAALRAVGKVGRKAIQQAATEGLATAVDSVLEDIEGTTGSISGHAREAREKIRTRKEEVMGRRKAREEEEDVREEEDEEDGGEEEADEEEDDDEGVLFDAEVMIRNAIYILEVAAGSSKKAKKLVSKAEELHEELVELIEEEE